MSGGDRPWCLCQNEPLSIKTSCSPHALCLLLEGGCVFCSPSASLSNVLVFYDAAVGHQSTNVGREKLCLSERAARSKHLLMSTGAAVKMSQ